MALEPEGRDVDPARGADRTRRAGHADPAAKEELIKEYMPLVEEVAGRHEQDGLPLPDLIQEGCIGLIQAMEFVDSETVASFKRRAEWWIEYAIRVALAHGDDSEESVGGKLERSNATDTQIKEVERCGKADCHCATYSPPPGLTKERLFEQVLRDLAPCRRRLARSGKGGDAALAHHEHLVWRRMVEATTPAGRIKLINEKWCPWRYARVKFWSGSRDVRKGRWTSGRRIDKRPERRDSRKEARGGPEEQNSSLMLEMIPMGPDDLRRAYEASVRWEEEPEGDEDPERLAALDEVLGQLRPVAREAIEVERQRQELANPPPADSTQRGRHRRARKPVCILILERPALQAYHALAQQELEELQKCKPRKPTS